MTGSVPFTISLSKPLTAWTPAQWITAWQSKADADHPTITGTINLPAGAAATWNNIGPSWGGTATSGQTPINMTGTWFGTTGNLATPAPLGIKIEFTANLDASATGGVSGITSALHTFTNLKGGATGVIGQTLVDTTSANNTSAPYEGGQFNVVASVNDNGTAPTPLGHLVGVFSSAKLTGTATHFSALYSAEHAIQALAGTSVVHKHGTVNVLLASDAVRGSGLDAAQLITSQYAQGATSGWKYGTVYGGWSDSSELFFPIGQDGTIIAALKGSTDGALTVANILDFSALTTVTGFNINMPNFSVTGAGVLTAVEVITNNVVVNTGSSTGFYDGALKAIFAATTVASSVNNFSVTNAATGNMPVLQTGGTDANVGMALKLATGSTGSFNFWNSSNFPYVRINGIASPNAWLAITAGTAGSNILLDAGAANGITIGGATATGLIIGNASATTQILGTLKGGAGTFTANGSVATALSSVGPAGAHTTVQEWLTITDTGGTVRYIPCF